VFAIDLHPREAWGKALSPVEAGVICDCLLRREIPVHSEAEDGEKEVTD